jgi:hypothetical protein
MTANLTRPILRSARALAAKSLKEIAAASGVDAWTISDFETGLIPSLGEHAADVLRALTDAGIRFETDGSISCATPSVPPAGEVGEPYRWITAHDLSTWGSTREGQQELPELIGRLILATVGPGARLRFPAGDSVQFAGWDGVCEIQVGTGNVPDGVSVWEFGAQRLGIRKKADDDYRKRSAGPTTVERSETTFIFVTPQRWSPKDGWSQKKRPEGIWKQVLAIDGDDLVHWLDLCPGVAKWLSLRTGKRTEDLRDIEQVFDEWSLATAPPLSADLLLADRDEQATKVRRWLTGPPSIISIQAEATNEGIAFLRAVIDPLPLAHRTYWESRLVVAGSDGAARNLQGLSSKLAIVMEGGDEGLAASLVNNGHHVFVARGSEVGASRGIPRLARPWRSTIQLALAGMGVDRHKAQIVAGSCGRSLAILRRLMPIGGGRPPSWAAAPVSASLLAAMLAGSWDSTHPVDRATMERLSGRSYGELEADLAPFASAIDGPMRRSGSVWKLASLRDAWFLLAGNLTSGHVELLSSSFESVMSEDNQGFDADPDQKWKFTEGPPNHASEQLRRGLAEAMTVLAVFPERATAVHDAGLQSALSLRKLLTGADQRRWWSLADDFRRLAEISPEAFLDCLEKALDIEPTPLMSLFRNDEGLLHKAEYLSNLLWALEKLAWSPDHLGRVAFVLCRLVELDPVGRQGNRPDTSLRRIFLPWLPQTFASAAERLQVIDGVLDLHPAVGWRLLVSLAPDIFQSTEPSDFPIWRDFSTDDPERPITRAELAENYRAIGSRLLSSAGNDLNRWGDLLADWTSFGPDWRADAEKALSSLANDLDVTARNSLRELIRQTIGKHEMAIKAKWSLKRDDLIPLRTIYELLEPADPIERHKWLFGGPTFDGVADWHASQEKHRTAQCVAVEEILCSASSDAVIAMAREVRLPRDLGHAIATSAVAEPKKDELLERALGEGDDKLADLSFGMLFALRQTRGADWLLRRFRAGVANREEFTRLVRLALALPADRELWDDVEKAGIETEEAYWKRIDDHAIPENADPAFVIEKLFSAQRGAAALTWVAAHPRIAVVSDLIVAILRHPSTKDASRLSGGATMYQHYVVTLFKRLDDDPSASIQEVIGLEWAYYRMLEHSERPARRLQRALATDPSFFVYLLSVVYPPEGDDHDHGVVLSEDSKKIAKQAYRVLLDWTVVPGSDDTGDIDDQYLRAWVGEVRRLAKEGRLVAVAESRIGSILSKVVRKPTSAWPPTAVQGVIEASKSDELESGFYFAERNARGVTIRRPTDGGSLERDLAAAYRSEARSIGAAQVRTRALLNRLAESYEREADGEDQSAEQRDW